MTDTWRVKRCIIIIIIVTIVGCSQILQKRQRPTPIQSGVRYSRRRHGLFVFVYFDGIIVVLCSFVTLLVIVFASYKFLIMTSLESLYTGADPAEAQHLLNNFWSMITDEIRNVHPVSVVIIV